MKKIIAIALLSAFCLTFLASCDMGNGLVSEMFGNLQNQGPGAVIDPDVMELETFKEVYSEIISDIPKPIETLPSVDVTTPISPMPPVEDTYEDGIEVPDEMTTYEDIAIPDIEVVIPQLEACGFIDITLFTPDGSARPLLTFGDLVNWDGTLDLGEINQGDLAFRGYAIYDVMPDVKYRFTTMSWYGDEGEYSGEVYTFAPDAYDIAAIGMQYEDRMTVFEFSLPIEALGEWGQTIYLSGHTLDPWYGNDVQIYGQNIVISKTPEMTTDTWIDAIDPTPTNPANALVLDGDLSDWLEVPHSVKGFDQSNLDAWVGEVEDNGFTMYTTANSEYVYFAFEVYDDGVRESDDGSYNGDAFQIMIDFNGWSASAQCFERGIFYSFGLQQDGTVDMTVQCIYADAAADVSYIMASDDEPEWREGEVKGVTKRKDDGNGWTAEFAVSWETLYADISNKLMNDGLEVPDWDAHMDEVELRMLICYLDHDIDMNGNYSGIQGCWGTSQYRGALSSGEGWYPEYAGVCVRYEPKYKYCLIESLFAENT